MEVILKFKGHRREYFFLKLPIITEKSTIVVGSNVLAFVLDYLRSVGTGSVTIC